MGAGGSKAKEEERRSRSPCALVEAKGSSVSVILSSGREIIDDGSCDHSHAESSRPILRSPCPLNSWRSATIIGCQEVRPRRYDGMKFFARHGRGVVGDGVRMFSRGSEHMSGRAAMAIWFSWIGGKILR